MTNRFSPLHHVLDLYEHHWQAPGYKPHLNSSRLATFKTCPRLYRWTAVKRLDALRAFLTVPIIQGSLYHAMTAAYDAKQLTYPALQEAANKIRNAATYGVGFSETLKYLVDELQYHWLPKYEDFLTDYGITTTYETLMLEQPLEVEFPTFVLHTIPDKVVRHRETGEIWVVERKTTSRDDSNWSNKWTLNPQTTAEIIAVEKTLDKPVAGVYIEPVVVTRKNSTKWDDPYPQPIHNFTHHPWRAVSKSPFLKGEWIRYAEGLVAEMKWRDINNLAWEPNYNSCPDCRMAPYCSGKLDPEDPQVGLVPLDDDYVIDAIKRSRFADGIFPPTPPPSRPSDAAEGVS